MISESNQLSVNISTRVIENEMKVSHFLVQSSSSIQFISMESNRRRSLLMHSIDEESANLAR